MKQSNFSILTSKFALYMSHVCCLLESQWKWPIYWASLVEYKVQLATFAVNTIRKSKWPFRLQDLVLKCYNSILLKLRSLKWGRKWSEYCSTYSSHILKSSRHTIAILRSSHPERIHKICRKTVLEIWHSIF